MSGISFAFIMLIVPDAGLKLIVGTVDPTYKRTTKSLARPFDGGNTTDS